jgi:hypothetical protein
MVSKKGNNLKTNDMKKAGKILGILLLVLIAAGITITGCHNARHEKKIMRQGRGYGMNQTQQYRHQMPMNNMRRGRGQGMKPGMRRGQGRGMQHGRGRGMGPGMGAGMNNGIRNGQGFGQRQGMMRGMRQGANNGMGNPPMQMTPSEIGQVGPGGIFIDKIPNVTEKQKKEYTDLLQKQKDEMAKMREDMAAKIKSTLESQRSKMLNLFTGEQKKYIGSK